MPAARTRRLTISTGDYAIGERIKPLVQGMERLDDRGDTTGVDQAGRDRQR